MERGVDDETGHGGGGGSPNNLERRVKALEDGDTLIIGKLGDISDAIKDLRHENETHFGVIESRLAGMEKALDGKADRADLKVIEAKLDSKAERTDLTTIEAKLGILDGRLADIPTTWQVVAGLLVGIAGVSFGLAKLGGGVQQAVAPSPTAPAAPGKAP